MINWESLVREVLYYDSLNNSNEKNIVVIYASDLMLNRITASKHIYIDLIFIHQQNFL